MTGQDLHSLNNALDDLLLATTRWIRAEEDDDGQEPLAEVLKASNDVVRYYLRVREIGPIPHPGYDTFTLETVAQALDVPVDELLLLLSEGEASYQGSST